MKQTLEQLAEFGAEFAKDYVRKGKEMSPSFIIFKDGKMIDTIQTPWANDEQKHIYLTGMGIHLKMIEADQYIFMTEAWVAVVKPDTPKDIADLRPAQRLDRDEVVFVIAASKDAFVCKSVKIVRNDTNIGFEDYGMGSDNMEGRLLDLLKDKPSKPITTETLHEKMKGLKK